MQKKRNLALFPQIKPNLTIKNIYIVNLIIINIISLPNILNCIFYKLYANIIRLFKRSMNFV